MRSDIFKFERVSEKFSDAETLEGWAKLVEQMKHTVTTVLLPKSFEMSVPPGDQVFVVFRARKEWLDVAPKEDSEGIEVGDLVSLRIALPLAFPTESLFAVITSSIESFSPLGIMALRLNAGAKALQGQLLLTLLSVRVEVRPLDLPPPLDQLGAVAANLGEVLVESIQLRPDQTWDSWMMIQERGELASMLTSRETGVA